MLQRSSDITNQIKILKLGQEFSRIKNLAADKKYHKDSKIMPPQYLATQNEFAACSAKTTVLPSDEF